MIIKWMNCKLLIYIPDTANTAVGMRRVGAAEIASAKVQYATSGGIDITTVHRTKPVVIGDERLTQSFRSLLFTTSLAISSIQVISPTFIIHSKQLDHRRQTPIIKAILYKIIAINLCIWTI